MRVPAAQRRQQLIEAAVRLMWRDGVEAATLREIAKEAGAPLASVHYCFTDKDELMHAAVEYWLQQLVGTMADDIAIEGGLRATVKRIADDFWTSLEDNPPNVLAQLDLALWSMRGGAHQALAKSIYPRYEQALGELFARALKSADEESTIPPGLLARAFVGIIDAASLQYLSDPESSQPRDLYYLMIEAVLVATGM